MYLVGEFSLLWKFALTGDFLNKNTSSTQRQNWRLLSHQTRIALAILNEPRDSFCREVI